jgi:7-keto-8-aminopelargonate synthetase-like enzyme
MAQVDLINRTFKYANNLNVIQKAIEDDSLNGSHVTINGKKVAFWGNCGYLGLNHDQRIKDAAIDAIQRYGIQFPTSRTYNYLPMYDELESYLTQVFEKPALSTQTTTLGHMAAFPSLITAQDVVIIDQKVHTSVQTNVKIIQANGTTVEVLRHNRMDMLESRIQKLKDKYDKIWYLADGVYSMHGDIAPMQDLFDLMNRYEQFWTYFDDSHGLGWKGKNGRGVSLDLVPYFHEKMIVIGSLYKGFGASSSVLVLPNEALKSYIRNCGPTMIFSVPSSPAELAAAIAAAKINLSPEIYDHQNKLKGLISYFLLTAQSLNIPLINDEKTPIFYVCIGNTERTIEMASKLLERGFLVNPTGFPAVNPKESGLRMTLTTHMTVQDIYELLTGVAELIAEYDKKGKNIPTNAKPIALAAV